MCDPATAILGASAIGGIGSLVGGGVSAAASTAAARTQAQAANQASSLQFQEMEQALQFQQQQYGTTQGNIAPFLSEGQFGLQGLNSQLANLLQPVVGPMRTVGLTAAAPVPAPPPSNMQLLAQTPGYQFTLQQGLQATQNSFAAQGLGSSGAALKGAANYAEGLAGTTYQQQYQNWLNTQQFNLSNYLGTQGLQTQVAQAANQQQLQAEQLQAAQQQQNYNMLSGVGNLGLQAALGQAGAGNQAASNIGQVSLGGAAQIGANITQAGAAQAAGTVGSANAITNALGGIGGNAASTAMLLALNNSGLFGGGGAGLTGTQNTGLPF